VTGKVTVGLASHWPCVTDLSGLSTYGPKQGRRAPHQHSSCGMVLFTFMIKRGQSNLTKGRIAAAHERQSQYFTTGWPFLPPKIPIPAGNLECHLIHGSWCPFMSKPPNGISIGSAVFAGCTIARDRPTTLFGR